jgi:hypothetical protein
MSDGWSQNAYHFVAVFASFIETHRAVTSGVETIVKEPSIALLGISTMEDIGFNDDEDDDGPNPNELTEATTFTAEVHLYYMQKTLEYYDK